MRIPRRPFQFGLLGSLGLAAGIAFVAWPLTHNQAAIGVLLCMVNGIVLLVVSLWFGRLRASVGMRTNRAAKNGHLADVTQIEFVGGPFDGDAHPFVCPPQIEMLGLPVTPGAVTPFKANCSPPWIPATSFAFYKLMQKGRDWRYVYVESRPGHEPKLNRNDPLIHAALEAGWRALEGRKREARK